MRISLLLTITILIVFACQKQAVSPFEVISVHSSSYYLPLNEYGVAVLTSKGDHSSDITEETTFYINDEKISGHTFQATTTGTVTVKGVYRGQESEPIEIRVAAPLNKKVLLEYYTAIGCGLCPWMGFRVDSLHKNHPQVLGYAIHNGDDWAIPGIDSFTLYYQKVPGFPGLRTDRGYVRDFHEPTQIRGLLDTIDYLLSRQPPLEIAIDSDLSQNNLNVAVKGKFYRPVLEPLYLTVLVVEDQLITYGQANYFSGGQHEDCPYTNQPNPIPEYENHNMLRANISHLYGDPLSIQNMENGAENEMATYQFQLENIADLEQAYIIAFVHTKRDNVDVSSVLNAQMVRVGERVGFAE